jgi:Tfp pilus assembly protein PilO
MLINGLQQSVLLLYAGPEITGGQLVFALIAVVAVLAGLINGYKFYLNKKSQELIQSKADTKQSATLKI